MRTLCDKLILGKTSKFDGTRCQILRLKCTKFDFRWGSAPDPAGGAYSAPQTICLEPTCKGREGVEKEKGTRGEGRGGERKGFAGQVNLPPTRLVWM